MRTLKLALAALVLAVALPHALPILSGSVRGVSVSVVTPERVHRLTAEDRDAEIRRGWAAQAACVEFDGAPCGYVFTGPDGARLAAEKHRALLRRMGLRPSVEHPYYADANASTSTHTQKVYTTAASTNAAAATTTGTAANHTTAYGGVATVQIKNGGTGPTIAACVNFYTSGDNSNFYILVNPSAGTTAGPGTEGAGTYTFNFVVPPGVMYTRADVSCNTGQTVTIGVSAIQELTSI